MYLIAASLFIFKKISSSFLHMMMYPVVGLGAVGMKTETISMPATLEQVEGEGEEMSPRQ